MFATRIALVVLVLVIAGAVGVTHGGPTVEAASRPSAVQTEARTVVSTFFRTLNTRRYARTCALLADAYFADPATGERRHCTVGLQASFTWAPEIRWKITGVRLAGNRVLVDAVALGTPGTLVLLREHGRLRILALQDRTGGQETSFASISPSPRSAIA